MNKKIPDTLAETIERAFIKAGAPKPASLISAKELAGTQLGVNPHLLPETTHVLRVKAGKQGEKGFFSSEAAMDHVDLPSPLRVMPGRGDQMWVVGSRKALEEVSKALLDGKSRFIKVTHTALAATQRATWAVEKGIKSLIPGGISK